MKVLAVADVDHHRRRVVQRFATPFRFATRRADFVPVTLGQNLEVRSPDVVVGGEPWETQVLWGFCDTLGRKRSGFRDENELGGDDALGEVSDDLTAADCAHPGLLLSRARRWVPQR